MKTNPNITEPRPLQWLLIGIALLFLAVMLVIPLTAVFAEALKGGLFFAVALRLHQRDDFACDKGKGNEQRRQNNAGDGENNLYALRFEPAAQRRVRAEQ